MTLAGTTMRRRTLSRLTERSRQRRELAAMRGEMRSLGAVFRDQVRMQQLRDSKAYSVTLYRRWIEEDTAAGRDTRVFERCLADALDRYSPRQIERARRRREGRAAS